MIDITFAPLSREHLDDMAEIEQLCFSMPWSRAMLADELVNDYAVYYVAEQAGRVAGYAGMHTLFDEAHITNIAVRPELRRMGVGGLLLDKLIRVAALGGVKTVTLEVRESNVGAIALYSKKGFLPAAIRKGYYDLPNEDAILMELKL